MSDIGSKNASAKQSPPTAADPIDILRTQFSVLADEWLAANVGPSSDYMELINHWAYKRIIALGQAAVPMILERLSKASDNWGFALATITRENPVPRELAGDVVGIADVWLEWGRVRKLIG